MKITEVLEQQSNPDYLIKIDDLTEQGTFKKQYPDTVNGRFNCGHLVELTSLVGSPSHVAGNFHCDFNNSLVSLKGGPSYVGGNFDCSNDAALTTLEGAPMFVGNKFNCFSSNIITLKGIGREYLKYCTILWLPGITIKSNILGLLLIQNLTKFTFDHVDFVSPACKILFKHFQDNKDVLECQEELISAGYKEYAKL